MASFQPTRLSLHGEYDCSRREEIVEKFERVPAAHPLVIDLSDVTYIDSTFLQELLRLHVRFQGTPIVIEGVRSNVRRVLDIVKFDQLFEISDFSRSDPAGTGLSKAPSSWL